MFKKTISRDQFLGDFCRIKRGFPWQKHLVEDGNTGILEGKNIRRYHVRHPFRKINRKVIKDISVNSPSVKEKISLFNAPKVLLQNIVAHLTKPLQFIEIYACVDDESLICLDTAEGLTLSPEINPVIDIHVVAAYLNSSFASWFAYRFIYSLAIRTMHFDNTHLSRLPFPLPNLPVVNETAMNEIKSLDLDEETHITGLGTLLDSILDLGGDERINTLHYFCGHLGKELHRIVADLNAAWEEMIFEVTEGLDPCTVSRYLRMKPYTVDQETMKRQLLAQQDFQHAPEVIGGKLDTVFKQLASGRERCLAIQKMIDRAIYGLFELDQNEIDEINSNYHLRPAI